MCLDSPRRHLQRGCNLAHAVALGNQLQHLPLPRSELGQRLLGNRQAADPFGNLRAYVGAAAQHFVNRRDQFLTRRVLRDEAHGACRNRFLGDPRVGVHREDDDLCRHAARAQLHDRIEPAQSGHREIRDDQVGLQIDSGLDEARPVEDSADHLTVVGEKAVQPLGHHHVVIGEQSSRPLGHDARP